jgi:hypothetical protein
VQDGESEKAVTFTGAASAEAGAITPALPASQIEILANRLISTSCSGLADRQRIYPRAGAPTHLLTGRSHAVSKMRKTSRNAAFCGNWQKAWLRERTRVR